VQCCAVLCCAVMCCTTHLPNAAVLTRVPAMGWHGGAGWAQQLYRSYVVAVVAFIVVVAFYVLVAVAVVGHPTRA